LKLKDELSSSSFTFVRHSTRKERRMEKTVVIESHSTRAMIPVDQSIKLLISRMTQRGGAATY